MKIAQSKVIWTLSLVGMSAAAWADSAAVADTAPKKPSPQEPAGFVAGAVIGAFAAGPIGAVVGAGVGTWLGSRVHRAHDAGKAEAKVAVLTRQIMNLQAFDLLLEFLQCRQKSGHDDNRAELSRHSSVKLQFRQGYRFDAGRDGAVH